MQDCPTVMVEKREGPREDAAAGPVIATDPRWEQLADVLVTWSTRVGHGDRVLITMVEPETTPLVQAVHAAVVRAGGSPYVEFQAARLDRDLLLHGSDEQTRVVPEIQWQAMQWADVSIAIRGAGDLEELADVPAGRLASRRGALGRVSALRTETTRWVVVRVPSERLARRAGMTLPDLMSAFFEASIRDWAAEAAAYRRAADLFRDARTVWIVGRGIDLTLSIEGRTWAIEDGHINMPGGEIFTSPVETSAEGVIAFEDPAIFAGRLISGIRLRFERGLVVEATADSNVDLLHELLDLDAGSRRIGELGFGMNPALSVLCGDLFFDEKVWGTCHIALGRSYAQCGGRNESALHWDIVKDLRAGVSVEVDGRTVFADGRFRAGPAR
jgi:aminopeptidase